MRFRIEILPFLAAAVLFGLLVSLLLGRFSKLRWLYASLIGGLLVLIFGGYFFWFFRDPIRTAPQEKNIIVSGADGVIAKITTFTPEEFGSIAMLAGLKQADVACLKKSGDILRVSIFLSLFDVHVNRAPISGKSSFLGYFPGKHLFTFDEKSSDVNQHNSILIRGDKTCCLINQIVGPVCRRVVYWLDHDKAVDIKIGEDFGMMKFGSRLDMYFPATDVDINVALGTQVYAGESIIGKIKAK